MKSYNTLILRGLFVICSLLCGSIAANAANNVTADTQLLYTSSTSANSGNAGSGDYFWLAANASFENALTIDGSTYYAANWKENCVGFTLGDISSYTQMDVKIYYAAKSDYYIKLGIGSWYNSVTKELGSANGTGNSDGLTTTISVTGSDLASYNQYVIYSNASSSSDVRFAGCAVTFTSSSGAKTTVTATLSVKNGTNALQVGDWRYADLVITGLDGSHTISTQNNSNLTYTSSNESVATIDTWSYVKAKGTGTTTLTATFAGDEYYEPFTASCDITVSDAPSTNELTATTLTNSSTIALTTSSNLDARGYFTANGTSTSSNGVLSIVPTSPISVASNGYTLSASSTTTEGTLTAYWRPEYASEIAASTFVSGCEPQKTDGNTTSTNPSTCEITVDNVDPTGYVAYTFIVNSWDNYPVSNYKYFLIELEEELPSTGIIIAAEYANDLAVDWKIFTTGRFIYVPFKPNGQLKRIGIGGNTGQTTIKVKSCGFVNSVYAPASVTVSNITVSAIQTMVQTNTITKDGTVYNPTAISYDNVYDTSAGANKATYSLGTEEHNGKTYTQVPYDYTVKVIPTFTDASTTEVLSPNYNCTGTAFDTDAEGETIAAFTVGNNSTNKGVVTPLTPGYGDVAISGSLAGYNSTSQRTHIIIVKAVGKISNPTGGRLYEVYSGTALGLTTKNSVDLDGKFKVFDNKGIDITGYGTFKYESSSLTVSGSTVSCSTATTTASVKIIWTPDTDHAPYYEAIHGTLYNIEVVDPSAGYYMELTPLEITLTEGDTYALSNISVKVTNNDSDVTSNGAVTYTIATGDQTYIVLSGSNLLAKLSDTSGNRVLTVTWTDNNDNTITSSKNIKVNIKRRVAFTVEPTSLNLTQGYTGTLTVTVFNDIDGDGVQDAGEDTINDISPTVTVTDITKAVEDKTAYLHASKDDNIITVTALNAGKTESIASGSATVTIKYNGSSAYGSANKDVPVAVTNNTCFDYIGWHLAPALKGTLTDPNNINTHYLHWRFAQVKDDPNTWVYEFIKPGSPNNNFYGFTKENLELKDTKHTSEKAFDVFCETYLTNTLRETVDGVQSTKGDAFLEYNGMIAGYGTELGGRYMTPVSGTFVRIEAEYDGIVTLRIRHNGSLDTSNYKDEKKDGKTDIYEITQARRALYVIDENGTVMPRTTVNLAALDDYDINLETLNSNGYKAKLMEINGTYCRIGSESAVNSTFDVVNDAYTNYFSSTPGSWDINTTVYTDSNGKTYSIGTTLNQDFSKNAFQFAKNVIYSDVNANDFNTTVRNGYKQKLFYSATDSDVKYKGDGVATTTYFFSKYGYEVLAATHVLLSFPVKAGKTYFVAANKSKISLCSVGFEPSTSYSATSEDMYEDATVENGKNSWLQTTDDGARLNVTLHRTFTAKRWTPLILPFSVSETQLKSIFGENVAVITLDGKLSMLSSMNNYATRDYSTTTDAATFDDLKNVDISNALKGTSADARAFNGSQIKKEAIRDHSVTFTRHYYQMIYANCPVFIWTDQTVNNPVFKNVTFQKYRLDKTEANRTTTAIDANYSVTFPYKVDRQIGTEGSEYDYVMKASYVKTTPTKDAYYMTNISDGSTGYVTYLYHALAGSAPEMKATRVWIEPGANSTNPAPLRTISMEHYFGDEIDDFGNNESGICDIISDQPTETQWLNENVYDISGRIVGHGSLDGLSPGLYIFRGTKCYVK